MSQVTKRALEQSLKNLLQKKPLNKITVTDITEDCGISRMTFYYHFKDIYDLVEWSCREDARLTLEKTGSWESWVDGYLQIFSAVRENRSFILSIYRCFHQEQLESYLKPQVDRLVVEIINQSLAGRTLRDEDKEFIARIYSHIFVGVLIDWIKEDMQADPRQIADRMGLLLSGSISVAISRFAL